MVFLWILVAAVIVYIIKGVIIVQQAEAVIVERLGRFERELSPGFNFIFRFSKPHDQSPGKLPKNFPTAKAILILKKEPKSTFAKPFMTFPART